MRRYGADVGMTARHIDEGLRLISSIILHTGRDLDQLTAEDVFHLRARPGARTARHRRHPQRLGFAARGGRRPRPGPRATLTHRRHDARERRRGRRLLGCSGIWLVVTGG
ncbi:hypothetical protein ACL07V_35625 [Streptomyces sp. MB22_4]|uniref:hypothetical protein n=1 Tax=Streptomyces sp. MB22_4 TaxID=3383120 RepID=UPI00399F30CB